VRAQGARAGLGNQALLHLASERRPTGLLPTRRDRVADLQRAIGNQALLRREHTAGRAARSDIAVSQPGDASEREADAMAQAALSGSASAPTASAPCAACAAGGATCSTCGEQKVHRSASASAGTGMAAPATIARALPLGAGAALDTGARAFFEPRFGVDFSGVRVHTGGDAADLAASVNARAFTYAGNIVFGHGEHQPGAGAGSQLLAHELAHVVQDARGGPARIHRQRCAHDSRNPGCKAERGRLYFEEGVSFGLDHLVVADMANKFGGRWLEQFPTPPNPVKCFSEGETKSGLADALKVTAAAPTGGPFSAEVLEVKSCGTGFCGGCVQASREAERYASDLQALGPRFLLISRTLAGRGGLRLSKPSNSPGAEVAALVRAAGIDLDRPDDLFAWSLYHTLQIRLGTVFTQPFTSFDVSVNADGLPNITYMAEYYAVDCQDRKRRKRLGQLRVLYQVNGRGGASYRCQVDCPETDEDEARLKKERDAAKGKAQGTGSQTEERRSPFDDWPTIPLPPVVRDPPDIPPEDRPPPPPPKPERREPPRPEAQPPAPTPEASPPERAAQSPPAAEGQQPEATPESSEDSVVEVTVAVAALAALHRAASRLSEASRQPLIKEGERLIAEKIAPRAPELARRLDSVEIQRLGTRAYASTLERGADQAVRAANRLPAGALARRLGPRAARLLANGGSRALVFIGFALTARDALALADHVSRGGQVELGLGGSEADLSGTTQIGGETARPGELESKTQLRDAQVDLDLSRIPDLQGESQIQADRVAVRGTLPEAGVVTVNLHVRLKDSTITIRHAGRVENGRLTLQGNLDIQDSNIVIDLPPGATTPRPDGRPVVFRGASLRITRAGVGGGGPGAGGGPSAGAATEAPDAGTAPSVAPPAASTPAIPSPDAGITPATPSPDAGTAPSTVPPAPVEDPAAIARRRALVAQLSADPTVAPIVARLKASSGTQLISEEVLRRLGALGPELARHPGVREAVLAGLQQAPGDPIAEVIVPLERMLAEERRADERALAEARGPAGAAGTEPRPATEEALQAGTAPSPAAAAVAFQSILSRLAWPLVSVGQTALPLSAAVRATWRVRADLVYEIPLEITLVVDVPSTDPSFPLAGVYRGRVPSGTFSSTTGGRPITFSDAGSEFKKTLGFQPGR
jgi:hypothetical protein